MHRLVYLLVKGGCILVGLLSVPRVRAFLLHVLCSAFFLGVFWLVLCRWYPDGLLYLQGGAAIFGMLVLVDLVIGPLLTLLVFVPGKKYLLLDLLVIVLLQVAAFGYGVWSLSSQRPAYMVFVHDRFFVVSAQDLPAPATDEVQSQLEWRGGPRLVFVKLDLFGALNMQKAIEAADEPLGVVLVPGLYRPFTQLGSLSHKEGQVDGEVVVPVVGRHSRGVAHVRLSDLELLSVGAK